MFYTLVAMETSHLGAAMPSEPDIVAAINRISMAGRGVTVVARLVGVPRITRAHDVLFGSDFRTFVTIVIETDTITHAREIANNMYAELDHISDFQNWSQVGLTPFKPAVNGTLQSWEDGSASITQTATNDPSTLAIVENPVGPTTPATHPGSIGQNLANELDPIGRSVEKLTSLLTVVGVIGGGVALLYFAWPVLSSVRKRSDSATPA